MSTQATAGWFGKVSMLGDFASRRLAPDWVQSCDHWLSSGMDTSQRLLGDGWLPAYLSAPLWRFAWAPGVVDRQWWFGVLMPSSDNVGRYYPLVVAQPRAVAPIDRFALDHLELWWQHIAQAALHTLAEDARVETFEESLLHAPSWPLAMQAPPLNVQTSAGREHVTVERAGTLEGFAQGLAATSLLQRLEGQSLWSPLGHPGGPMGCTMLAGLPKPEAFVELLTGRW